MKKICIVTTSIGKGGAERFSAVLSFLLSEIGYDIHILTTKVDVDYDYSGKRFCLEEALNGSKSFFKKTRILKSYFKKNDFDILIDNRTRPIFIKEYILYKYIFKAKKVISIVHSYYLEKYLPSSAFLARLLYKRTTLITVSKEIQKKIIDKYKIKNCKQIYNPVDVKNIEKKAIENLKIEDTYILFFGRIEQEVKNLNLLLRAYKNSNLIEKGVKLYILGDGKDISILKQNISRLKLKNYVCCIPFLSNPFPYVKNALFTTLTSYYEGFPMSLIESLACGIPVVSVNCKSGPKEVIKDKHNGLLVENHNISALVSAFNAFVEDESLYLKCKANAKNSVEKFSMECIKKDWAKILKE